MCMGRERMYPLPGAGVIVKLKPGDEVVIRAGFGHPPLENDSTHIIAAVQKFSALTADGVMLCCYDGVGVEPTGNRDEKYELSPEAKEILNKIHQEAA